MVKIKLITTSSNGNSEKGKFNLNSESNKNECIRKIIDLIGNGYENNNNRHNISLNSIGRGNNVNTRSRILTYLNSFNHDTNIIFTKPNNNTTQIDNNNFRNNITQIDNNNSRNNIISGFNNIGGMNKEYITLQSGGRRLVKYGKRGGRYYIKGGNKVYLK